MAHSHTADDRSIDIKELPVVELDERDYRIAQHIAIVRQLTYSDISGGTVHGGQSAFEAHETGVLGEFAVAKFFDGTTIFDIDALHERGDHGHDLTVRGVKIDVKTTATDLDVPDLIVPERPAPVADRFVLAHRIAERNVRIVGMATVDEVISHPVVEAPGTRRNYWIPPSDLTLFTG